LISALIRSLRPKQWTKNAFIFAPLIFDEKLLSAEPLIKTIFGFLLLCLISGTVYLVNDVVDIEKDRQHPTKRHRPIPSGELPLNAAIWTAILLPAIGLPISFLLDPLFGVIITTYLLLQIAYSFLLKNIVIIDVLTIAAGFVLRVAAGVPLVEAERFSPWLYVFTTLLALFLGLGKRRQEIGGAYAHHVIVHVRGEGHCVVYNTSDHRLARRAALRIGLQHGQRCPTTANSVQDLASHNPACNLIVKTQFPDGDTVGFAMAQCSSDALLAVHRGLRAKNCALQTLPARDRVRAAMSASPPQQQPQSLFSDADSSFTAPARVSSWLAS